MVANYIKELLQESDEVIVQDLGTFQTSYHSAEIHPATHAFTPPSKKIAFNPKLKISNLLLENYISQKEGIPLSSAKEEVQKFVSSLKVNLGIEKRAPFDNLGELLLQASEDLEFKQSKEVNLLNDSFGMPEIYAKPIERTDSQKNAANQNTKKTPSTNTKAPTEPPKSTWGTIAAIGSLAFVVLAVVYVVAVDSSLNPFNSLLSKKKDSEKKEEIQPDNNIVKNEEKKEPEKEISAESSNPEKQTEKVVEEKKEEQNNTSTDIQANNNSEENKKTENTNNPSAKGDGILVSSRENKFYIVVGGFGNQANAYKKVNEAKSKGINNVKIVPPFDNKNLYRVAIGAFSTRQQADDKLEEVKGQFGVDAWILKY
jgi:cell division septation protein DedD